MKLGTENKKKTIIAAVLAIVAALLLAHNYMDHGEETSLPAQNAAAPAQAGKAGHKSPHMLMAQSLDPSLRFDLLKSSEDVTYKGTGRNIFRSQAAPPPQPIPQPVAPGLIDQAAAPPPPPPIDLKFYGYAGPKGGARQIFLLRGEDIFLAREGQIIDRRYKIMHIGPTSVEIQDVLTNNTQTIPLSSG